MASRKYADNAAAELARLKQEHPAIAAGIPQHVVELLIEQTGIEEAEITIDAKIVEDLGLDSLDVVELAMGLEEKYHVEFDDERAERAITVGDLVRELKDAGARV